MIVQCAACQTRFKIAEEKVTERGVKVRCTKCTTTFIVRKDAPAVSLGAASLAGAAGPSAAGRGSTFRTLPPGSIQTLPPGAAGLSAGSALPRPGGTSPLPHAQQKTAQPSLARPNPFADFESPSTGPLAARGATGATDPDPLGLDIVPGTIAEAPAGSAPVAAAASLTGSAHGVPADDDEPFGVDTTAARPSVGPGHDLGQLEASGRAPASPRPAFALGKNPFSDFDLPLDFGSGGETPIAAPSVSSPGHGGRQSPFDELSIPLDFDTARVPLMAPEPATPRGGGSPSRRDNLTREDFGAGHRTVSRPESGPSPLEARSPVGSSPSSPRADIPETIELDAEDVVSPGPEGLGEAVASGPSSGQRSTRAGAEDFSVRAKETALTAAPAAARISTRGEAGEGTGDSRGRISPTPGGVPVGRVHPVVVAVEAPRPQVAGAETQVTTAAARPSPPPPRSTLAALVNAFLFALIGLTLLAMAVMAQTGSAADLTRLDVRGAAALLFGDETRGFVAAGVTNGLYPTASGHRVFIVRGTVRNLSDTEKERVRVEVELRRGTEVSRRASVLAGALPTAEEVHGLESPALLDALNARLAERATTVEPGREAPFAVVFYELPGDLAELELRVTLAEAMVAAVPIPPLVPAPLLPELAGERAKDPPPKAASAPEEPNSAGEVEIVPLAPPEPHAKVPPTPAPVAPQTQAPPQPRAILGKPLPPGRAAVAPARKKGATRIDKKKKKSARGIPAKPAR
jgi:predicted Zn finger-like uncharacterized protein